MDWPGEFRIFQSIFPFDNIIFRMQKKNIKIMTGLIILNTMKESTKSINIFLTITNYASKKRIPLKLKVLTLIYSKVPTS